MNGKTYNCFLLKQLTERNRAPKAWDNRGGRVVVQKTSLAIIKCLAIAKHRACSNNRSWQLLSFRPAPIHLLRWCRYRTIRSNVNRLQAYTKRCSYPIAKIDWIIPDRSGHPLQCVCNTDKMWTHLQCSMKLLQPDSASVRLWQQYASMLPSDSVYGHPCKPTHYQDSSVKKVDLPGSV